MTPGHSPPPKPFALQDRLIRFLTDLLPPPTVELAPETAIFGTGRFDSLALVQLVTWVEEAIGAPIDPGSVDIRRDWATIADLTSFIERQRPLRHAPAAGASERKHAVS